MGIIFDFGSFDESPAKIVREPPKLKRETMKILLIGAVNQNNLPKGGQEFKNQLIVKFLIENTCKTKVIDTIYWRKQPKLLIVLLFNLFFISYDKIILSTSSASAYRLVRILYYLSRNKLSKTVYLVIGGYFPKAVTSNIYSQKYYQGLFQIVVEGYSLKEELKKSQLEENVSVIPNFKSIKPAFKSTKIEELKQEKIKFVFLSRITPSKGISEIFAAVELLLQRRNLPAFTVDFYGPVEASFEDRFFNQIDVHGNCCTYKGYLDLVGAPEQSYQRLSNYDCMLFPTYWKGEGFPGVVVDAFIAGLPIIASDWNMNSEIIEEGETGYLIAPKSSIQLAEAMERVILDTPQLLRMKINCVEKATNYDCEKVLGSYLIPLLKR